VRWYAAAAALAVIAVVAAPAGAEPDTAPRAQAAAHVRQGQAYFQRSDFDRALTEYQAAFDLSAEPSLIFNIALCHDRAQRPEAALAAFRRYLALAPNGSVADEARSDVARLVPIVERIEADRAAQKARDQEAAAQRAEAATSRIRLARYAMLGGAAVVAGGAAVHIVAWRTASRLDDEKRGPPDPFFNDRHALITERNVAYTLYAVGGVALAAGVVLALTAPTRSETPRVSAALVPGGAAMVLAWSR
jgi:tetratricopeptide (TPR) repeat protein